MAAQAGDPGSRLGHQEDEDKVGELQRRFRARLVNLELAKKPPQCLEYIVVHELVHLLERHHNDQFTALMNEHLPQWRQFRKLLNSAPLGHESWSY